MLFRSPDQVERARELAAQRGQSAEVRFECADYLHTPFPDAGFDVVWALESLCHAADKPAFYREAARLLRPGGRLVVAEYMRTRRNLGAADARLVDEWCAGWAMPDLDTDAEHVAAARAAGFGAVTCRDFTPSTRRSLLRLYCGSLIALPVNAIWHGLGLRCDVQYRNVIASMRQYQALRRGLWQYRVLTALRT